MKKLFFPLGRDERSLPRGRPSIFYNGDELAVGVRDVTPDGAQLECDNPPPAEALVTFKGCSGRRTALVRWSSSGRMGIQFNEALSPEEMDTERKAS